MVDPVIAGFSCEDIRLKMDSENIETRPLWKPMHMQPVFEGVPFYGDGMIWSSSFYSCKMEDSISRNIDNLPKEIADCKKWLTSQEVASGFLEERDIDWSKAEMKTLPDGNTLQIKLKIGRELNSVGNDSITELQIAKLKYGYEGRIKVSS